MNAGTYLDLGKRLRSWTFFNKNRSPRKVHWSSRMLLQKPAPRFPARRPILLGSSAAKIWHKQVSQKYYFCPTNPLDTQNWSVHELAKNLSQKDRIKLLNQVYKKNRYHWRSVLDMQKASLKKPAEKTSPNVRKVFTKLQ